MSRACREYKRAYDRTYMRDCYADPAWRGVYNEQRRSWPSYQRHKAAMRERYRTLIADPAWREAELKRRRELRAARRRAA
jgi:hypothetical protein